MSNAKTLLLQVRYPYTAGVIATIWLGTALLLSIDIHMPVKQTVVFNSIASLLIALLGFTSPRH